MSDFSDDQVNEFRELFALFDKTGESKIAYHEVGECLRAFGQNPTNGQVAKVLNSPSQEDMNNKYVSFDQFLPMLAQVGRQTTSSSFDDFVEGLRVFDKENNGTVLGAELRHVLCTLGEKLTEEEVEALISGHEDANGCVNYESFIRTVIDKDN